MNLLHHLDAFSFLIGSPLREFLHPQGDSFQPIDFDFNIVTIRKTVWDFVNSLLMNLVQFLWIWYTEYKNTLKEYTNATYLHAMNDKAWTSIKFLVTNIASKVRPELTRMLRVKLTSYNSINSSTTHLKCLAFWCWIRIFSSSNSRWQYLIKNFLLIQGGRNKNYNRRGKNMPKF